MYYLYLQFTSGSEGYYSHEERNSDGSNSAYLANNQTNYTACAFPSYDAAKAKAKRMIDAGYRIAYYEIVER